MLTHGRQHMVSRLPLRLSFSEPASGLRAQLPCRWVAWASCSPPFQRYLGGQARSGRHEGAKDRWQATSPRTLQGPGVPEAAAKRRFLNPLGPDDLTQQSSFIAAQTRGCLDVPLDHSNEDFCVVGNLSCRTYVPYSTLYMESPAGLRTQNKACHTYNIPMPHRPPVALSN